MVPAKAQMKGQRLAVLTVYNLVLRQGAAKDPLKEALRALMWDTKKGYQWAFVKVQAKAARKEAF